MRDLLRQSERCRSLCMWHDHATLLKMGFILVTVHIMYDPIVFYTQEEYDELHPGVDVSVQGEVEQLEIHLFAVGSSTIEHQASLVDDRLSCVLDLSTPVITATGTEISDSLRFFTGDLTTPLPNLKEGQNRVVSSSVLHVGVRTTSLMIRHTLYNTGGGLCNSSK